MREIIFVNSTNINFGRGKDKTKRKSRIGLASSIATGATIGASKYGALGALSGAGNLAGIGIGIDKDIDKEKTRFKKSGSRSRLGKVANDAKSGARNVGGATASLGLINTVLKTKGKLKDRAIKGIGKGLVWGAKGALAGGLAGSSVGTTRGLVQPNKKKSLLQRLKDKK
jgi:hypothetical protein